MRELKNYEIAEVSGSGLLATAGQYLGYGSGVILGMLVGNEEQQVTNAAANIGGSLGFLVEKTIDKLGDLTHKALKFLFR